MTTSTDTPKVYPPILPPLPAAPGWATSTENNQGDIVHIVHIVHTARFGEHMPLARRDRVGTDASG